MDYDPLSPYIFFSLSSGMRSIQDKVIVVLLYVKKKKDFESWTEITSDGAVTCEYTENSTLSSIRLDFFFFTFRDLALTGLSFRQLKASRSADLSNFFPSIFRHI
jgi:hypothetical protein